MNEPSTSVWSVRSRIDDDPLRGSPIPLDEFPTVAAYENEASADLEQSAWESDSFDYWSFDRLMDPRSGEQFHIRIRTSSPERIIPEVLTRCQRLLQRKNAASSDARFASVLDQHRRLHDLSLPLVRADFDHSLDVWQWVLRLDRGASEEVQIGALFHDIERLESEATRRIEHLSTDYELFKNDHAARGAQIVAAILTRLGYADSTVQRVAELVAGHEHGKGGEAAMLLNEADALSFFSFNSPGFFDYFDGEHCRRKVAYTLRRLGARGKRKLSSIRLRGDVARMLRQVEDEYVSSSN